MKNELRIVPYMLTTQTRPMIRCGRSPWGWRTRFTAPSSSARDAPTACMAIRTGITLL